MDADADNDAARLALRGGDGAGVEELYSTEIIVRLPGMETVQKSVGPRLGQSTIACFGDPLG